MKSKISIILILFTSCILFLGWKKETTHTIKEAVSMGLVKVQFSGGQGYSGKCMSLTATNLKKTPVTITLR